MTGKNDVHAPTETKPRKFWQNRSPLYIVISAILLTTLLGGGYFGYKEYSNRNKEETAKKIQNAPHNVKYPYSYSKMDSYTLPGEKPGMGMTLEKPVEIKSPPLSKDARLVQNMFWHVHPPMIATIAMASVGASTQAPISTEAIEYRSDKSIEISVKGYLEQKLSLYEIKIITTEKFSSDNLKKDAWTVKFTASPKSKNTKKLPNLKGVGVLAIGQSAYYYAMVNSVEYNWDTNENIWIKVLNSIKINQ